VPIEVTCLSCRGAFNAPDSAAGKRAKCPTCGGVISIPQLVAVGATGAAPAVIVEEPLSAEPLVAEPEAGRKHCPMCGEDIAASAIKCRFCGEILDPAMKGMIAAQGDASDPAWRRVRTGLATIYYCLVVIIVAVIVMCVGGALAFAGGGDPPVLAMLVIGLGALAIMGAGLGTLVGQGLCCSVPESSGARGFMIGAIGCLVANVLFSMFGSAAGAEAISGFGNLVSLVGAVLFMLFIRQSAIYLGNFALGSSVLKFLMFAVGAFVGCIVLIIAAAVVQTPILIGIAILIGVVCAIIYFAWYLSLIRGLMTTIDQRTAA